MRRYYGVAVSRGMPAGWLTACAGLGYFVVWTAIGAAVFAIGVSLMAVAMRQLALFQLAPVAMGVVVTAAGGLQLSAWKTRHLARCRVPPQAGDASASAGAAWRYGLCLGRHCACSCAGPMAIALALGVMDLRVMAVVTAAITVERLAPAGERAARRIGMIAIAAGVVLIARAAAAG